MIIKVKRKIGEQLATAFFIVFTAIAALIGASFISDYVVGAPTNITNGTVIARVNITNTEPNITSVTVDDDIKIPAGEIDLTSNGVTVVTCNATVFDYNGWQDIHPDLTNATFYIQSKGRDGDTDNNYRYRNESCGRCIQIDATTASCDCRFAVQYYANYSTEWICNITVGDSGGTAMINAINLTDTDVSGTITVTKLLAIDTGTLIDYGNLSVTETSPEIVHNVTNTGNIPINITLRGFGGLNESIGQNLSMICDYGNITFGYQRYEIGTDKLGLTSFDNMVNLTNQSVSTNLTLYHRSNDSEYGSDRNATLWRLQVPLGVGGICNGTTIFGAIDASE
jgi:hypothetical protein